MDIEQILEGLPSDPAELAEALGALEPEQFGELLAGLQAAAAEVAATEVDADDAEAVEAQAATAVRLSGVLDALADVEAERAEAAAVAEAEAQAAVERRDAALNAIIERGKTEEPAVEAEVVVDVVEEVEEYSAPAQTPTPGQLSNAAGEYDPTAKIESAKTVFDADNYEIGEYVLTSGAEAVKFNGGRRRAGEKLNDRAEMAALFASAINSGSLHNNQRQTLLPLVSRQWSHGNYAIGSDTSTERQHEIVQNVLDAHRSPAHMEALVASCADGDGCCPIPPLDTQRGFVDCAQPLSYWRQTLPTINVEQTGGLRWMKAPDWRKARQGIGFVTAAENCVGYGDPSIPPGEPGAVPDGGHPFKTTDCSRVPCPTVHDLCVDELYACVILDHLQLRVWPELVEKFMDHLDIAWQERIDNKIACAVDAASTPVLATNNGYDTWRNYHQALRRLRAAYEGVWHVGRGERLEIHLPEWMLDKIAVGLVNDHSNGYGERLFGDADNAVRNALRGIGFEPYFYRDDINCGPKEDGSYGGRGQIMGVDGEPSLHVADDGTFELVNFPTTEVSYIYPSGTFAYLDGGDYESGIYRDHELHGTNSAALFRTHHCEVAMLGCESVALFTNSEPCGKAAPTGDCELVPLDPADIPGCVPVLEEGGGKRLSAEDIANG